MIYRNTDLARSVTWIPEENPAAGEVARKFLEGERELLHLSDTQSSAIVPLHIFLESTSDSDVEVERGVGGELLVRATDSGESLMITGKTASVLRSWIDLTPVRTSDREEMTIRRRA